MRRRVRAAPPRRACVRVTLRSAANGNVFRDAISFIINTEITTFVFLGKYYVAIYIFRLGNPAVGNLVSRDKPKEIILNRIY